MVILTFMRTCKPARQCALGSQTLENSLRRQFLFDQGRLLRQMAQTRPGQCCNVARYCFHRRWFSAVGPPLSNKGDHANQSMGVDGCRL